MPKIFQKILPREARSLHYREDRGIKIAMIGDSTIRDFAMRSIFGLSIKAWIGNQRNAFLNSQPHPLYESVYERMAQIAPVCAVEFARGGATVGTPRRWMKKQSAKYLNVKSLEEQIKLMLKEPRTPDLTLIWIGHNNLDFLAGKRALGNYDQVAKEIEEKFLLNFREGLLHLIQSLQAKPESRAIIVYGLINPEASRQARESARKRKVENPRRYPYFERSEQWFLPLKTQYGDQLNELSRNLSRGLEELVGELNATVLVAYPHLRLIYSDATAVMDFSNADNLSEIDGWHASDQGKQVIAAALFEGIQPALGFLKLSGVTEN